MAREIRGASPSGTLYARIINSAGLWWNGSTFEAYTAANYANYDIAMTEQGNSGVYVADFPSTITTGGTYDYFVHRQAGGSPAEGDVVLNTGRIEWGGSAVVAASASAMLGSEFLAYVLRKGFKRTDKNTELYEAMTDAIQIMRRRFGFDEAKVEMPTTDSIATLGEYKLDVESDLGLVIGVRVEDDDTGTELIPVSKSEFESLYPSIAVETDRGFPKHYCVFGGQLLIGPMPDLTSYVYRISYSKSAGAITSSVSVPFTTLYRDVLCDLVLSLAYEGLEEFDKADRYRALFEAGFEDAKRRERLNAAEGTFQQEPTNF